MVVKRAEGNTIRRILDIINAKAAAPDAATRAAAILTEVEDVHSFYEAFVEEVPDPHLAHFIEERSYLEPVLMATFVIIAAGELMVEYVAVDEGDDIVIGEDAGIVTVSLRHL